MNISHGDIYFIDTRIMQKYQRSKNLSPSSLKLYIEVDACWRSRKLVFVKAHISSMFVTNEKSTCGRKAFHKTRYCPKEQVGLIQVVCHISSDNMVLIRPIRSSVSCVRQVRSLTLNRDRF